jgi:hypothetical protein
VPAAHKRPLAELRRDRAFAAALLAALPVWAGLWWLTQPPLRLSWPLELPWRFFMLVFVYPALEEIVFRGLLQELLLGVRRLAQPLGPLTGANLAASLAFAGLHLFGHAPLWALAVLVPSLVFGYFWDRYRRLGPCVSLHVFYNAGYFWLFPPPG